MKVYKILDTSHYGQEAPPYAFPSFSSHFDRGIEFRDHPSSLIDQWNILGGIRSQLEADMVIRAPYTTVKRPTILPKPIDLKKTKYELVDAIHVQGSQTVMSQRLTDYMQIHAPYVEALPIVGKQVKYYILYFPNNLDPFDYEKSIFYWLMEQYGIKEFIGLYTADILKYEFKQEILAIRPIFSIYREQNLTSTLYIRDDFLKQLKQKFNLAWRYVLVWDSENPNGYPEYMTEEQCQETFSCTLAEHSEYWIKKHVEFRQAQQQNAQNTQLSVELEQFIQKQLAIALKQLEQFQVILDLKHLPTDIISNIGQYLIQNNPDATNFEEIAETLGVLWGEQVVRAYQWHWLQQPNRLVIVSSDQKSVLHPHQLIMDVLLKQKKPFDLSALFASLNLQGFSSFLLES
jgi:hypothetical protein